ncbi:MAG: hypothetical protein EZS28_047420 [Streblomastix strix]|uniref:Uncharacterized protein n=1 Tax=Streblomastix strix TaxID=222440 RepID=A0A5J4TGX3_9EUKA|nr:MAG: hypothetical protein EZS28_047420 [Streblomastix strix]
MTGPLDPKFIDAQSSPAFGFQSRLQELSIKLYYITIALVNLSPKTPLQEVAFNEPCTPTNASSGVIQCYFIILRIKNIYGVLPLNPYSFLVLST